MTRRTPALALLTAATALALVACSHPAGSGSAGSHGNRPANAGLGANADDTNVSPPDDSTGQNGDSGTGNGNGGTGGGNGGGYGGGHASPSPSTAPSGPRIVTFTASGAVCPAHGPGYDQPGQVTVSWKIANADGVSLAMDGGLWKSYDGAQGSDTLPFQCPNAGKTNTHKYTLTIKNTHVTKTVSASAPAEPA